MGVQISQVVCQSQQQLEIAVTQYIAQGYVVANRTATSASMMKKKEFSIVWLLIGLLLCFIPLVIYLIIYASEDDLMVELRLAQPGQDGPGGDIQLSPDGLYWWDGTSWQNTKAVAPPTSVRSPDGLFWWDGKGWRPVPG